MAIPPTPKPTYPNVPAAPGVPPLLRSVDQVQVGIVGLVNDARSVLQFFQAPPWGLYTLAGQPILAPPSAFGQLVSSVVNTIGSIASLIGIAGIGGTYTVSVLDVEVRQDYRIATAPQEQGAFTSYNKVQIPYDARITFAAMGNEGGRAAFLSLIVNLAATLDLFSIVMPEFVFPSVNVVHYGLRRAAQHGVSMIVVDVWLQCVRVTGTAQFSTANTGSPSGADATNIGNVSPINPASVSPNSPGAEILSPSGLT